MDLLQALSEWVRPYWGVWLMVVFLAIVLAVNFIVDVVCALLDPKRTR